MRGLTALAMVFVAISLMDSSVIATLDSSEIIVKQVYFVVRMCTFIVVTVHFILMPSGSMLLSCLLIGACLVH